jgi:hypothetical protein
VRDRVVLTLAGMVQGLPLWLCAGTGDAYVEPPAECAPCRGGFVCDEPVSYLAAAAAVSAVRAAAERPGWRPLHSSGSEAQLAACERGEGTLLQFGDGHCYHHSCAAFKAQCVSAAYLMDGANAHGSSLEEAAVSVC